MKLNFLLAALVIAGSITPVLADEYYVVRDPTLKKCTIVTEKPASTSSVTILGVTVFKTHSEAEGYMKKEKVCTTE